VSDYTRLMARDGREFNAWLAAPTGAPRGAVVVLQEIFGLNSHIRAVADGYAAEGYLAIAPSLFDRVRRDVDLPYTADAVQEGRGYAKQLPPEKVLLDIAASIAVVKHAGRVATVGFCWGGTQSWLAAAQLPVTAAVCYYGTAIAANLDQRPRVPVLCHFGDRDQSIPPEAVAAIRAAHPDGTYYTYPADHGFNCDQRATYDAASATLARQRTLAFLAERLTADG
jgi:carboxymethylenebutenolidase